MFFKKRKMPPGASPEELVYADAHSGDGEKKKHSPRRLAAVLAALAAVALVLGCVTLWLAAQRREDQYRQARTLLEQKDYDGAAARLQALEDYRDSRALLEKLEKDEAAYRAALDLVDQQRYEEAVTAFRALGDYADSPRQADFHVTYRKALDLMAETEAGQTTLLTRILPDGIRLTSEGDYPTILGYEVAAALLESLGDYEDAPARADDCYLAAGRLKLARKNWGGALAYLERMSEEAAGQLYQEYLDCWT